jgi:hypothetical protein
MAIKGSMGNPVATKVKVEVLRKYPKFDFMKSDANYKWQTSPVNQRVISQVEGVLPRVTRLAEQSEQLGNGNWSTANKIINAVNKEFGKPEVTDYEGNLNAIVQEVNTALSGSSTGSDLRVKLELENLRSARSPQQLTGAITNLYEALLSRLDVQLSVPYPIEVVRGEKTALQYREETAKKYRGMFKASGVDTSSSPKGGGLQPDGKGGYVWKP